MSLRLLLLVAGAAHLTLGALMALGPRTFFEEIGAYVPFNDHYIRDVATFYLALGAALLVAVRHREWQAPVLFVAVLQYGLHVLNHLWDVGDAEPGWLGPANVAAIGAAGAALWWLRRRAARGSAG
jgi:hypothetical protein